MAHAGEMAVAEQGAVKLRRKPDARVRSIHRTPEEAAEISDDGAAGFVIGFGQLQAMPGAERAEFRPSEIAAHDVQVRFVGVANEIQLRRLLARRPFPRYRVAEVQKQA